MSPVSKKKNSKRIPKSYSRNKAKLQLSRIKNITFSVSNKIEKESHTINFPKNSKKKSLKKKENKENELNESQIFTLDLSEFKRKFCVNAKEDSDSSYSGGKADSKTLLTLPKNHFITIEHFKDLQVKGKESSARKKELSEWCLLQKLDPNGKSKRQLIELLKASLESNLPED